MLLEDPPFFAALELASLAVVAALDGVAHGRHFVFLLSSLIQEK